MDPKNTTPYRKESTQLDPAKQLERDRKRNDERLKGTFEHIFAKYGKDFSDIGDEIDLETGRIIVNNGHVASMQDERDVGRSPSRRLARAFTEELGSDIPTDNVVQYISDDTDEDELSPTHQSVATPRSQSRTGSTTTSGREDGHTPDSEDMDADRQYASLSSASEGEGESSFDTATALTQGILGGLPAVQNLLPTTASPQRHIENQLSTVDPVAINALGQSIANQIAQFLSKHVSAVPQSRSQGHWDVPPLPLDLHNSTPRMPPSPSPFSLPAGLQSPMAGQSLWAMPRNKDRSRHAKKRKLRDFGIAGHQQEDQVTMPESATSDQARLAQPAVESDSFAQRADAAFRALAHGIQDDINVTAVPSVESDIQSEAYQMSEEPRSRPFEATEQSRPGDFASDSRYFCRFSQEEDDLIKVMKELRQWPWRRIVRHFPGRTLHSLQKRYHRVLRNAPIPHHPNVKREIIEINDDEDDEFSMAFPYQVPQYEMYPLPSGQTPSPRGPRRFPAGNPGFGGQQYWTMPAQGPPWPNEGLVGGAWSDRSIYPPPPGMDTDTHSGSNPPEVVNSRRLRLPYSEQHLQLHGREATDATWDPVSNAMVSRDDTEDFTDVERSAVKKRKRDRQGGRKPRYRTFDTTKGNGTFGVLRSQQPLQVNELTRFAAQPQEAMLGPITAKTGTFGVLRMGKSKPSRPRSKPKHTPRTSAFRTVDLLADHDATHTIETIHEEAQNSLPDDHLSVENHVPHEDLQDHSSTTPLQYVDYQEYNYTGDDMIPLYPLEPLEPQGEAAPADLDSEAEHPLFVTPDPPNDYPTPPPIDEEFVLDPELMPLATSPQIDPRFVEPTTKPTPSKDSVQENNESRAATGIEVRRPTINRDVTPLRRSSGNVRSSGSGSRETPLRKSIVPKSVVRKSAKSRFFRSARSPFRTTPGVTKAPSHSVPDDDSDDELA